MLYFAYGSNMNEDRMKTRKTNFEFRTGAKLHDYALTFNKKAGYSTVATGSLYPSVSTLPVSKELWKSKSLFASSAIKKKTKFRDAAEGYANVVKSEGDCVQGALYVIPEGGLKELDICEGFPDHYYREVLKVECSNGVFVDAIVYIASAEKQEDNLLPSDTYLNHLLQGIDIMTEEYYNKLVAQKTISEFTNKSYSNHQWRYGSSGYPYGGY